MLTKIGMAVLAGTIATTAVAGTAGATEVRVVAPPPPAAVMVTRPAPFAFGRRWERERLERERLARMERERQARLERERFERLERERFERLARERRERERRERLTWFRLHHSYADGRHYNR
jgi:hypothetical protein